MRIFDRKCVPCHRADSLAMPLTSYRDVRDWGRAIREEIVEQRMPPWSAARGYARVQNELALTTREATTILSWLDGGMPRGDDRDLPRGPAAAGSDTPDLHLTIPPQRVPALEPQIVRRVAIDTNLDSARTLKRLALEPQRRGVLRGAMVFAGDPDRGGRWIGAWLPWQPHVDIPEDAAMTLPARARLTIELHYRGGEQDLVDNPSIDLFFTESAVRAKADASAVRLKTDPTYADVIVRAGAPARLASATTIWAILPDADASTTSLELTARKPNGAVETLVWIPNYHREWLHALALRDTILLPAGTTLTLTAEPASAMATARLASLPAP